ncbi:MAG: NifB/NifX family molybdenum-iron cluster-binding protein [Candidatus Delongbacteria bacterium]
MKKKFAVPTRDKKLCEHFGHCQKFAIIEVDDETIIKSEFVDPPAHEPGLFPKFLSDMGVSTIIAGGMGQKAQNLFSKNNIEVCVGVDFDEPSKLVRQYLNRELRTGKNLCDH